MKQLVAAITTRLFNPDNVRDRNWDLSSHNTILALGHIAVTLHTQVPSDDIGIDLKILLHNFHKIKKIQCNFHSRPLLMSPWVCNENYFDIADPW